MAVICITALLMLFGLQQEVFLGVGREMKLSCYEEILKLYMPGVVYSGAADEQTVAERLLSRFFLLEGEQKSEKTYPTQVESELSYEAILAREAADENYVDEDTGEIVMAGDAAQQTPSGEIGTGSAVESQAVAGASPGKVVTYSREKLNDFDYLIQNFYQVDSTTTIDGSELNAEALLGKDLRLSHDTSTPQILIYHTHSQEGYSDSVPGDSSTSVVGVGDYLTRILTEQYGLNVIHHKGEYDVGDRDHAYSKAGPGLEQILKENPSIEVVIDLHRDGVREDTRLVTDLNGAQTAQIMFFNGLSRTTSTGDIGYLNNPYIADNLSMSFQMQLKAAEYYPGLTRRIYLKGYRYNMHYCPKTLLVEVGAQTNTVQEAMNAMVPLADILNKVLTGPQ
ncbi:MAG: stage II sporulation protein P [Roseburia sp.]